MPKTLFLFMSVIFLAWVWLGAVALTSTSVNTSNKWIIKGVKYTGPEMEFEEDWEPIGLVLNGCTRPETVLVRKRVEDVPD